VQFYKKECKYYYVKNI